VSAAVPEPRPDEDVIVVDGMATWSHYMSDETWWRHGPSGLIEGPYTWDEAVTSRVPASTSLGRCPRDRRHLRPADVRRGPVKGTPHRRPPLRPSNASERRAELRRPRG
jgi:hypothetical protein